MTNAGSGSPRKPPSNPRKPTSGWGTGSMRGGVGQGSLLSPGASPAVDWVASSDSGHDELVGADEATLGDAATDRLPMDTQVEPIGRLAQELFEDGMVIASSGPAAPPTRSTGGHRPSDGGFDQYLEDVRGSLSDGPARADDVLTVRIDLPEDFEPRGKLSQPGLISDLVGSRHESPPADGSPSSIISEDLLAPGPGGRPFLPLGPLTASGDVSLSEGPTGFSDGPTAFEEAKDEGPHPTRVDELGSWAAFKADSEATILEEDAKPLSFADPSADQATWSESSRSAPLAGTVLLIDHDSRAARRLSLRLAEKGYSSHTTAEAGSSLALAGRGFDAVVVEVPAEQVLRDRGVAYVASLALPDVPVVFTSTSALDPAAVGHPRAQALVKPYFIEDLVRALETARSALRSAPRRSGDDNRAGDSGSSTTSTSESARPESARPGTGGDSRPKRELTKVVPAAKMMVRAVLRGLDGQVARGRIRAITKEGVFEVESRLSLPKSTPVSVDVTLVDGRRMDLRGVVTAVRPHVTVSLTLEPDEAGFLGRFIEEAEGARQSALEPMRITQLAPNLPLSAEKEADLEALFKSIAENLDDDPAHQAFIQACLRIQKVDFAVRCYRGLQETRPEDERVERYLHQVGTILSFFALKKDDAAEEVQKMPASMKLMIGGLVVVLLLFLALWLQLAR